MAMQSLAKLRRDTDAHMQRLKVSGVRILKFAAPCCGESIETRAGQPGRTWDTLATCQHCGSLYLKFTTARRAWGAIPEGVPLAKVAH